VHDQRAARAGFSLAHAELDRTGVWIDDWRLELEGNRYQARIAAREFEFDFTCSPRSSCCRARAGFSRKGHRPGEASYYYSRPQLNVVGKLNGKDVEGTAWLDHEWSSAYLAPEASGWDWCGINLLDGGSLTAFQMRDAKGGVPLRAARRVVQAAAHLEVTPHRGRLSGGMQVNDLV
jgi:predicted secreted hydrolase